MLTYHAILDDFTHALSNRAHTPIYLTQHTRARLSVYHTRARLSVYQNNVRINRIAALTEAFTNVVMLVGTQYFHMLAGAYVDAVPAPSANLHDDGASLPTFIRDFPLATNLPYLADIAQVDWLLQRAYYANHAVPLDALALTTLGAERFATATLRLMPSVSVAHSDRWPIADILAMHNGGPAAKLEAGGQSVLIWRDNALATQWQAFDECDINLAMALLDGYSIEAALSRSGASPDSLLTHLFRHQLVHLLN